MMAISCSSDPQLKSYRRLILVNVFMILATVFCRLVFFNGLFPQVSQYFLFGLFVHLLKVKFEPCTVTFDHV